MTTKWESEIDEDFKTAIEALYKISVQTFYSVTMIAKTVGAPTDLWKEDTIAKMGEACRTSKKNETPNP